MGCGRGCRLPAMRTFRAAALAAYTGAPDEAAEKRYPRLPHPPGRPSAPGNGHFPKDCRLGWDL